MPTLWLLRSHKIAYGSDFPKKSMRGTPVASTTPTSRMPSGTSKAGMLCFSKLQPQQGGIHRP